MAKLHVDFQRAKIKMEYVLTIIKWPNFGAAKARKIAVDAVHHIHDHFIPHARNNYHPHVFSHRALALFSALLVASKVFTLSLVAFGPVIPAFSSAITPENIITLTNTSRQDYNLAALTENSVLDKAAQTKADDMLAKGYFSHNTPDGKTPWNFITTAGYNYLMAGENLAVNFTEAENVEQAWMNSPGHKANILNKNYEEIGIGIAQGVYQGHEAIFVVQMFGVPAEQKITLTDVPTKVQTQTVPPPSLAAVAAASNTSASGLAVTGDITIENASVALEQNTVKITAKISSPAVKAIAYFGQKGIMLEPKADNLWTGSVPLSSLAQGNVSVKIAAYDIAGQSKQIQLADFSSSTVKNFNVLGAATANKVSWLGKVFDPKVFEQKFYLIFIAGLLSCLAIAIAVRHRVQHLSLIANGSFVIIFAALLLLAG